jgi:hypothetical protein
MCEAEPGKYCCLHGRAGADEGARGEPAVVRRLAAGLPWVDCLA